MISWMKPSRVREVLKMPTAQGFLVSCFGGKKHFITNHLENRLKILVCEGSQQECFSIFFSSANKCFVIRLFLLTGSFLLPPKNHKTAQNFFWVYVFVCLIHLILFMAHFFASNWESKKTILLLVLLLNFNISPMFFLFLPSLCIFRDRIIVQTRNGV